MDFFDVESVLVEFMLEYQLLQIVEGLLMNSLQNNTIMYQVSECSYRDLNRSLVENPDRLICTKSDSIVNLLVQSSETFSHTEHSF